MPIEFKCDVLNPASHLPHFWEHTIGSGHATLALRADWQEQMRRCRLELGVGHVRFHGLLCDDMGTLVCEQEQLLYSFFNADRIFDFLLSIGMKPFVELSFMPSALASGGQLVFHYLANVTPPKELTQWSTLIHKLIAHWVDRYGLAEVRQWFFEVWNEPNLKDFWAGSQSDYFELYRHTVAAIKIVDASLRVGGPATAANAWIGEFIDFCGKNELPLDFITTHQYPNDSFGKPGDDTVSQLAASRPSALREEIREVRRAAGSLPVYYTEWGTSSNPRNPMHDEPYAASFIVKTILEAQGLVQAYSFWAFSDIFEENYFPSVPFHGGFGLLNIHGIAKPSYRAFELLHGLGEEMLPVEGSHPTVDVWVVRGDAQITVLMTNYALPRHAIERQSVRVSLSNVAAPLRAGVRRIDAHHANAKALWQARGEPEYLSPELVEELHAASRLRNKPLEMSAQDNGIAFEVVLEPLSVTAVTLTYAGSRVV